MDQKYYDFDPLNGATHSQLNTPTPPSSTRKFLAAAPYLMLFAASAWGMPAVARGLSPIVMAHGYSKVADELLSTRGYIGVGSIPTGFYCSAAYFNAKKAGISILLLTTAISATCAFREGNIYPGILGIAGALIGTASYLLSRTGDGPREPGID